MDIDNGLGLSIVIFFACIGVCMFTLFVCNACNIKKCCTNQNNNEYNEV